MSDKPENSLILGEPISVKELMEIIERMQGGKSTYEEEMTKNINKSDHQEMRND